MSSRSIFRTSAGRLITVGKQLGKGGEGVVHEVEGDPKIAVKLYHSNIANERKEKIIAMVSADWHATNPNVAFPIEALYSQSSQFVGFTMRRVGGHKPIHTLYSPTSRKTEFPNASFRFLVRAGLNIARALAAVNSTGCVVGDINHSGFLVSSDATVTLIDCDSFQVQATGKTFYCKVAVPEFTPPELQGKRLDQTIRTVNHDAFGLAILLFNLLFMGRHPFAGKYLGKGDMPMEAAIAQYRFAYSARKNETRMDPPPGVPLLTDVPRGIGEALEIAFGQIGVAARRRTPSDWVRLLEDAEKNDTTQCPNKKEHQYFRSAASCPWCAMEKAYPGFLAFAPPFFTTTATPIDLGQLIAAIRTVPDPGLAPGLQTIMPVFAVGPVPAQFSIKDKFTVQYFVGLLVGICSVELFFLSNPAPLVGAAVLAGSAWFNLRGVMAEQPFQKILKQMRVTFSDMENRWKSFADNRQFVEYRREAEERIRQFLGLDSEQASRLAGLQIKLRDAQLNRFLEQYHVYHARIKGVGTARKATLRSYGIETAADVQRHRVENISGFGPAMAGALIAWRTSLERKFVFDSTQPINPADIAAVRSEIAKKKSDLQSILRQWLPKLRSTSDQIVQSRNNLRVAVLPVWNALKQAESDERAFKAQASPTAKKWAFAIVVGAAFLFFSSINSGPRFPNSNGHAEKQIQVPPSAPLIPSAAGGANPILAAKPVAPPDRNTPPWSPPPAPSALQKPGSDGNPAAAGPSDPAKPDAPLNPPLDLNPATSGTWAETHVISPGQEVKSLLVRENVLMTQTQLKDLGFLSGGNIGVWDSVSQEALKTFKVVNGLPRDDVWDLRTEQALASDLAVRADQSFIGVWSETPRCTLPVSLDSSVVIDSRRAKSATGACEFLSIATDGAGWRAQSKCNVNGKRWTSTIKFNVNADKLIWGGKEVTTYFRCK